MRHFIVTGCLLALLTGCGSYHADFACNQTYPGQCAPIHSINEQLDSGEVAKPAMTQSTNYTVGRRQPYPQTPATKNHSDTNKNSEETVHIWLAGYYDSEGHYHQPHTIEVGHGV